MKKLIIVFWIALSPQYLLASSSIYEADIFDSLLEESLSKKDWVSWVSSQSFCRSIEMCSAFREAGMEFLFQYGDLLTSFERKSFLNLLSRDTIFPFTAEQWADYKLLLRQEEISQLYIEFSNIEFEQFTLKLCVYAQDLLGAKEKSFCRFNYDFDAPAKELASLLQYRSFSDRSRTQIFILCRTQRKYPCKMLIKDKRGRWLTTDRELWMQPALAYSRKRKIPVKKDGHTPSGLMYINGVMPKANRQFAYGKFRRLIVDFVEDHDLLEWLPEEHLEQDWWQEAQMAKEVGRKYLRIHGTGQRNSRADSTIYPFVGTRGCVAKRENYYRQFDVDFKDQRDLLEALMRAQKLEPTYENHPHIRSVMYLVEIDNQKRAVTRQDVLEIIQ